MIYSYNYTTLKNYKIIMDSNDYKKASLCYLIGNFFNKGIAFLTIPIFTRLLSTTDYGLINTYTSWVSIITLFIGCALFMGLRCAFVDFSDNIDDYLSTIIKFTVIISFTFIIITLLIIKIFKLDVPITLVILCLINSSSCAIIENISMYYMMKFNYIKRTILMIAPNLLSVISAILLIRFVLDNNLYYGKIVPEVLFYSLFAILIIISHGRKKGINKNYLKHGLKISLPLIIHGAALNILSQSDRIMITWLDSASNSGIYSLSYSLGMITYAITLSIDGIWIPWLTNKITEKSYKEINFITEKYIKLITYIMCCLIVVSPEILKILSSKAYWEGIRLIPIIILANFLFFAYNIYTNVEHYYKKSNQITALTIFAAILNLVLNYIFIPKFGYVAAAYTTAISYFVVFILHSFYSKTLNSNIFHINIFIVPIFEILTFCGLFYLFIDKPLIRWIIAIVYLIIVAFVQRKTIINLLLPNLKNRLKKNNKTS